MKVHLLKFNHKNYYGGGMMVIAANSEEEAKKLAKEEWWFCCMLDLVKYEYLTINVTEPQVLAENVYEEQWSDSTTLGQLFLSIVYVFRLSFVRIEAFLYIFFATIRQLLFL